MSDNDNKDPVSNELKPPVQSTTDGALQQLKAQLALIESCLRAGRYSWALETVRELNSYGLNLEQTLARMVRPCCRFCFRREAEAPVVALAKDGAEKTGIDVAKDESKPDAVAPPAAKVWTPPSPEQVQRSLNKMFGHLSEASDDGDVVVISFNGHLLDLPKAQRLVEPLKWFIKRGHVVLFQETNRDALKYLSTRLVMASMSAIATSVVRQWASSTILASSGWGNPTTTIISPTSPVILSGKPLSDRHSSVR
ncbi:MAG: hypothetical protein IPL73_18035 [Candidatus Obscuribacter sp.]|nr:hypothetical protein [Candidatus Obscuribacter sp.]